MSTSTGKGTSLSDLIPGWPSQVPAEGSELVLIDDHSLSSLDLTEEEMSLVKGLRKHLRQAAISKNLSVPLGNAIAVSSALETGDLKEFQGRWAIFPLDKYNRRVFVPLRNQPGSSRTAVHLSKWFQDDYDKIPNLPEDGRYLVIYGGDPAVLDIQDCRERIKKFISEFPIADIVFRTRSTATGKFSTVWSVREGFGVSQNERIDFPNKAHIKEIDFCKN